MPFMCQVRVSWGGGGGGEEGRQNDLDKAGRSGFLSSQESIANLSGW